MGAYGIIDLSAENHKELSSTDRQDTIKKLSCRCGRGL